VSRNSILSHGREQAEAVKLGHHHVGKNEVRFELPRRHESHFAIGGRFNSKAGGAQKPLHIATHIGVVVHHQDELPLCTRYGRKVANLLRGSRRLRFRGIDGAVGQPTQSLVDVSLDT
jgi:hypothetical protein